MRHLDLFSGIGGFALAARWAGWETIGFVEKEKYCRAVLRKHWPGVTIWGDIRAFRAQEVFGPVDIITGGFPCQPVSLAGRRKGAGDDRWLWPEMLRVVREVRPRWLVAENVPGLRTLGADGVLADLETEGYTCWPLVVGADDVGAVHRRKRVWIVAYAGGSERWPQHEHKQLSREWQQATTRLGSVGAGGNAADAGRALLEGRDAAGSEARTTGWRAGTWDWRQAPEPTICRMDDGLPRRLDRRPRLAALGNAIVPQIAYEIFRAIEMMDSGLF